MYLLMLPSLMSIKINVLKNPYRLSMRNACNKITDLKLHFKISIKFMMWICSKWSFSFLSEVQNFKFFVLYGKSGVCSSCILALKFLLIYPIQRVPYSYFILCTPLVCSMFVFALLFPSIVPRLFFFRKHDFYF